MVTFYRHLSVEAVQKKSVFTFQHDILYLMLQIHVKLILYDKLARVVADISVPVSSVVAA